MNTLILQPSDVLFFKDGRPMAGSQAGHGAAWPMPDITNHAIHAALHRSELEGHTHRNGKSGKYQGDKRDKKFGSVKTAGPFPVLSDHNSTQWFFPTPLDLQDNTLSPALLPLKSSDCLSEQGLSSLQTPLKFSTANRLLQNKNSLRKAWMNCNGFEKYLSGASDAELLGVDDSEIADTEESIGIGIDYESGCAGVGDAEGKIYSAHYLRLRDNWRLGLFAASDEKFGGKSDASFDILEKLIPEQLNIIIGGQQRACSAQRVKSSERIPMPMGLRKGFEKDGERWLVKWVLLTPAIWPEIRGNEQNGIKQHPGGWLPNWIDPENGSVKLKDGDSSRKTNENRTEWRKRVRSLNCIEASLVSAIIPKPIVITGWASPKKDNAGGAKSSHYAVPAGAVYYFEANSEEQAQELANALNWHGKGNGANIENRRSALLGEKGYGIGVCGRWHFYETSKDVPNHTS